MFAQDAFFQGRPRRTNGERAFAEGVQHGELFRDGPGSEALPERALALQKFGEVEAHGVSLRNCFSKRCHASCNPCRASD